MEKLTNIKRNFVPENNTEAPPPPKRKALTTAMFTLEQYKQFFGSSNVRKSAPPKGKEQTYVAIHYRAGSNAASLWINCKALQKHHFTKDELETPLGAERLLREMLPQLPEAKLLKPLGLSDHMASILEFESKNNTEYLPFLQALGLSEEQIENLRQGKILHQVGHVLANLYKEAASLYAGEIDLEQSVLDGSLPSKLAKLPRNQRISITRYLLQNLAFTLKSPILPLDREIALLIKIGFGPQQISEMILDDTLVNSYPTLEAQQKDIKALMNVGAPTNLILTAIEKDSLAALKTRVLSQSITFLKLHKSSQEINNAIATGNLQTLCTFVLRDTARYGEIKARVQKDIHGRKLIASPIGNLYMRNNMLKKILMFAQIEGHNQTHFPVAFKSPEAACPYNFIATQKPDKQTNVLLWSGVTTQQVPEDIKLGMGSYGIVQLVDELATGNQYAFKVARTDIKPEHKLQMMALTVKEARLLRSIYLEGDSQGFQPEPIAIIEQIDEGLAGYISPVCAGNLTNLILNATRLAVTKGAVLQQMYEVIGAVRTLHEKRNTLHRDIKSSNILYSIDKEQGLRLQLCDLGSAKSIQDTIGANRSETYTQYYRNDIDQLALANAVKSCDEVQARKIAIAKESYAIGATLWNLLTSKFYIKDAEKRHNQIRLLNENYPPELITLVVRMLTEPPEARPTVVQIHEEIGMMLMNSENSELFATTYAPFSAYPVKEKSHLA
ncbi:MAG: protein kinase [Chlamydiales bacterium]|nr:protein kinase [Chlamydiales bacterium]